MALEEFCEMKYVDASKNEMVSSISESQYVNYSLPTLFYVSFNIFMWEIGR